MRAHNCSILSTDFIFWRKRDIFLSRRIFSQLIHYAILEGFLMIPLFLSLASLFGTGRKGMRHQVPFILSAVRDVITQISRIGLWYIYITENAMCLDFTIKRKSERKNSTVRQKFNEKIVLHYSIPQNIIRFLTGRKFFLFTTYIS